MKIELRRKVEPDNTWYNVWQDGMCVRCFGVHNNDEKIVRKKAEDYCDRLAEIAKDGNEKVIKSIEI